MQLYLLQQDPITVAVFDQAVKPIKWSQRKSQSNFSKFVDLTLNGYFGLVFLQDISGDAQAQPGPGVILPVGEKRIEDIR